jgi:hypothetical protein
MGLSTFRAKPVQVLLQRVFLSFYSSAVSGARWKKMNHTALPERAGRKAESQITHL